MPLRIRNTSLQQFKKKHCSLHFSLMHPLQNMNCSEFALSLWWLRKTGTLHKIIYFGFVVILRFYIDGYKYYENICFLFLDESEYVCSTGDCEQKTFALQSDGVYRKPRAGWLQQILCILALMVKWNLNGIK